MGKYVMTEVLFIDLLRCVHLTGLAIGFGLAAFVDTTALRSILVPITQSQIRLLTRLHYMIFAGLALLWVSGLMLLYMRTGFVWDNFSPKLLVKLSVVSLLTINAVLVGGLILPTYQSSLGKSFAQLAVRVRLKFCTIAAISTFCWLSGLALGAFSQMRDMSLSEILYVLQFIAGMSVLGAAAVMIVPTLLISGLKMPRQQREEELSHKLGAF